MNREGAKKREVFAPGFAALASLVSICNRAG